MNPFDGMTTEQITEATGVIPISGLVASLNGEKRKFEGSAGIEVLRNEDAEVEAIFPGHTIIRLTMLDDGGDVLIFTFAMDRPALAKRLA